GNRAAPWESGYGQYYALGAGDSTNLGDGTYFNGDIDEFRISNVARSNAWLTAQYLSMKDTFIIYGAPGFVPGAGEDLDNFPVLFALDATRIDYAQTQGAGQDLLFVDADNQTVLPHEIELWDSGNTSYVWVKVPRIDALSTTDFVWMYYGNAGAADSQQPPSVWSEDYAGVWHLNGVDGLGRFPDALGTGNDGINNNEAIVPGWIASGIDNDPGASASISLDPAPLPAGTAQRTLCGWARSQTTASGPRWIAAYGDETGDQAMFIGMDGAHLYGGGSSGNYTVPDAFPNEIQLTFDNTAATEDLQNFAVLVTLDATKIDYADTQDQGQDIRFFDADGATPLSHQIELWNESGTSYVWVKVPQIDAGSNADFIIMRYGNPTANDIQDPTGVWDTNYVGVWHLNEDPSGGAPQMLDSTTNGYHLTSAGTMTNADVVAGQVNSGIELDGTDDYLISPNMESNFSLETMTYSIWFNAAGPGVIVDEVG
ncbi:MAG: DUF2341 domain-containing protein, partial [Caldilineaceae bacterium]|nr:DUF2341 domain-containing protein [Caldilineaceae bacterium]